MGIAWLFYMYAVGPAISSVPIFFLALLRFDYIFARSVGEIFPFIWIVIFQVLEQLSAIGETNGFPTRGSLTDLPTAPPPLAQLTMPGSYYQFDLPTAPPSQAQLTLGMSTFRFFVIEHFVFFPSQKNFVSIRFCLKYQKKTCFKYFDIELVTIYGGSIRY